ncbi:MAG TPA: hypothetical protein VJR70_08260 [Stellaceae bacterium]|nr:hypothetical protein [Stellaceae bacterium]
MNPNTSVADSELPTLKRLASEIAGAEAPELGALEQIAALAAEIAARFRETARRELVEQLMAGVPALFPAAGEEWQAQLASAAVDDLTSLAALLGDAETVRTAFAQLDAQLMAARERGDYAAMAPLAIEADAKKSAFAAVSGEAASRLGIDAATAALVMPAAPEAPAAAAEPASEFAAAIAATEPEMPVANAEDVFASIAPPEPPASNLVELGMRPTTQAERRRIRDLIRQVRATPEDAS